MCMAEILLILRKTQNNKSINQISLNLVLNKMTLVMKSRIRCYVIVSSHTNGFRMALTYTTTIVHNILDVVCDDVAMKD